MVKDGLTQWQELLSEKDILPPDKGSMFDSVLLDFKQWQKHLILNEKREEFTGDILLSKYDTLKIIKHLQENWADIGLGIFNRHKSLEGEMPSDQEYMEEIIKNTRSLYQEYEIRINGDNVALIKFGEALEFTNPFPTGLLLAPFGTARSVVLNIPPALPGLGISKILPNLISSLDFCSFKLENLEFPDTPLEEWQEIDEKINEMKSQLDILLSTTGIVPQHTDEDSSSGYKFLQ
ncbi:Axonemal dynein light chain domain-containing protein 1 [Saguinus oedipus]|uniref:Axonemal dynein light chain domain-containing protein 1 n=1 Tax=Saguinus oedipus TaxID=9490 RepID=A0ABQ9TJA7_SAGOE|nr:Axonemal dynein light chain domain-containing protein 1 [Saguinus oedipus]